MPGFFEQEKIAAAERKTNGDESSESRDINDVDPSYVSLAGVQLLEALMRYCGIEDESNSEEPLEVSAEQFMEIQGICITNFKKCAEADSFDWADDLVELVRHSLHSDNKELNCLAAVFIQSTNLVATAPLKTACRPS